MLFILLHRMVKVAVQKKTEQISLWWHGFECNREFLESKFYSLRFPCPFGKPTFSRESPIVSKNNTVQQAKDYAWKYEEKKKEEKIQRTN